MAEATFVFPKVGENLIRHGEVVRNFHFFFRSSAHRNRIEMQRGLRLFRVKEFILQQCVRVRMQGRLRRHRGQRGMPPDEQAHFKLSRRRSVQDGQQRLRPHFSQLRL